jgi:Neuraminidase (sialidase)
MKINTLWAIAIAVTLCGCVEETPVVTYHHPLTSPGGKFSQLPPAVQNSVRAEAGMAEIADISRDTGEGDTIYQIRFRNADVYPPLYVASDGSVLTSNMTVAVGATVDTIAASTGSSASGIKMDDLPSNVVETIRHQAPTAEVASLTRLTSEGEVFYSVTFKDPARHPKLLVRDSGKLVE